MRILIDIGHPAHVHLFRNFAREMLNRGHTVEFTCRDRENVLYLLDHYKFKHFNLGPRHKTAIKKALGLIEFDLKMLKICRKYKPDMFLSHGSILAAHMSFLFGKPHVSFEDTFNMEQVRLYRPFTKVILTGDYIHPSLGNRELRYPGYHELAYLHPRVYKPDPSVLKYLGINPGEKYAIVRFIAWDASHDLGHQGLSVENKLKLVAELSKRLKVFISSEARLPRELEKYKIKIPPELMHDALYHAHLYIGESGTMASESMVLGTRAIFFNVLGYDATQDQEKYGILSNYSASPQDQSAAIHQALEIASTRYKELEEHQRETEFLLQEKINVTDFLVWLIEHMAALGRPLQRNEIDFSKFH